MCALMDSIACKLLPASRPIPITIQFKHDSKASTCDCFTKKKRFKATRRVNKLIGLLIPTRYHKVRWKHYLFAKNVDKFAKKLVCSEVSRKKQASSCTQINLNHL